LINLIGNAIKFTSKGGIRIELKQDFEEKQMINISVNDTGIGIKNEDKIKLFTMYGRLEDGRNVNKHGVGLGLTISNVLAVLLSGKKEEKGIEVESKYGEGSKFSFKILKDITVLQEDQNLLEKTPTKEDERQDLFSEIDNERQLIEKNKSFNPYFEEFFSQNDMESKLAGYMNAKKTNMLDLNSKVRSNKSLTRGKYFSHEDLKQSNPSLNEQLDYQTQEAQLNIVKSREEFGRTNFVSIPASEKQKTILVVDDNPFNLLVTGNFVKDLGFPIKTATSGHEAIEITKNCAKEGILLKVILMDCQMPIMDGYETSQVLCQMMKTHEIPKVPIFALTANSQNQEETSKCFEAGMEGYLTKPTSMEVLYQTLIKLN